jgi:hypothetical protein
MSKPPESPLKNVPMETIENGFAKVLAEITGYRYIVRIKDIDFETGETVIKVDVLGTGMNEETVLKA